MQSQSWAWSAATYKCPGATTTVASLTLKLKRHSPSLACAFTPAQTRLSLGHSGMWNDRPSGLCHPGERGTWSPDGIAILIAESGSRFFVRRYTYDTEWYSDSQCAEKFETVHLDSALRSQLMTIARPDAWCVYPGVYLQAETSQDSDELGLQDV